MTLMFAGHDTTTSTVTFLLYELARHPDELEQVVAEVDEVLGGEPPRAEHLGGTALPRLEMALDETLRLYPPAWIGPRRTLEAVRRSPASHVPGGATSTTRPGRATACPSVFPDPQAFVPERFTPEAKAALPKGAYVPFGGGSRTCIGMRFGREVEAPSRSRAIARSTSRSRSTPPAWGRVVITRTT